MSTRLTEHLINHGLSTSCVNVLNDGGYWSLDTLLDAIQLWQPLSVYTATSPGMALHEYLHIGGFGPAYDRELMQALHRYQQRIVQPWAPSPLAGELAEEIVQQIHNGTIAHGEPLTPASHLVLAKRVTTNTASTAHHLLARRGYLAMRKRRPIALKPGAGDYEVRYCPSINEAGRDKAARAVALARRHPGLWRRTGLCRRIAEVLRPLFEVEYDDAGRVMTVLVINRT